MNNGKTTKDLHGTTNSTINQDKREIKIRNWKTTIRAKGEKNTLPSMTVPDMALSLKVLLERHTRGQEVPILQGQYEYDEYGKLKTEFELPNIENLSLVEKLQIAADHREHVKAAKQDVIRNKKESLKTVTGDTPAVGDSPKVKTEKKGSETTP